MGEKRQLDTEEKRITEKSIEAHEFNVELLEYQKKKAMLELEGLPLLKRQYQEKLASIRREQMQLKMLIEQSKKSLEVKK